jgi:predicted enzyme related to lactoylglutathione lyase
MAARIRHIALSVKDIDATADFYEKAFGLKRSPKSEGPTAYRVYMSDGEINLALLQYKSEVGSGIKKPGEFVGIHHFGFQCDDLEQQQKQIEKAGGKFFSISATRMTTTSSASSGIRTASSSTSTGRAGA